MIDLSHVTFTYPGSGIPVLSDLCFHMERGEFVLVCGPSGCGKTTLLRLLKPQLRPFGSLEGTICFHGADPMDMSGRDQTAKIGFVQQSPENQIVTDKVWHELAFAMESLGYETETIRKKVTEMTEFFGIGSWFYKNVAELSGGQKQLLNLAAVMTLDPEILVLDEPTSQLDPVAAGEFLSMLGKINRELGIAVLLSEHRLEEAIPLADRMVVLEKGRTVYEGSPKEAGRVLSGKGEHLLAFQTSAMRLWAKLEDDPEKNCPISVREGKDWLRRYLETHASAAKTGPVPEREGKPEEVLRAEELFFRYKKDSPDVVKGLNIRLYKGEFAAILGGNGTGKTTAMKLMAGLYEPQHGFLGCDLRRSMLPQDPKTLFARKTVREELEEMDASESEVTAMLNRLHLEETADRNPFDLSGGEQQRLALGKLLLTKPEILLLDEPTKGLDAGLKKELAVLLKDYVLAGNTVLMISHDVEFAAEHTDRCMLFFDGNVVAEDTPSAFFEGNRFYTTAVCRMTRGILEGAVTEKDVLEAFSARENTASVLTEETVLRKEPAKKETVPEPMVTEPGKPKKRWNIRKTGAVLSGFAAAYFMGRIISQNRLSEFIENGKLTDHALTNVGLYVGLILSFACLIASLGSWKNVSAKETGQQKEETKPSGKLSGRTKASIALLLLAAPATVLAGLALFGGKQYYLISLVLLAECMIPFVLNFEGRKPGARELALLAVMTAIAIAGRTAFFAVPGFTPIFGIVILAGVGFGAESGFLVGGLSMLLSNFLFGQGPWTPWQMFCMGLVGFCAGILFRKGRLERKRSLMASVGAILTVAVYGGIMNPASALMVDRTGSSASILAYYFAGLPVDLVHGAATFVVLWFFGEEFLYRIDRVKTKYGIEN